MAWVLYHKFKTKLFTQVDAIDFDAAATAVKIGLVTNSYTPDAAADEFWSTPSAEEVSGWR
jgi:hypothetical protein